MLTWLQRKRDSRRTARILYGSIVTQSRQESFYAAAGVPDTPEGRFEMLILHLVLLLHRLSRTTGNSRPLQEAITAAFAVDMDDNMREMTVGDLAVPRHVRRAVAVLHDRYALYGDALAAPRDDALIEAVRARLGALRGAEGLDAAEICAYLRRAAQGLDGQPDGSLLSGRLAWPEPRPSDAAGASARQDGGAR
jgi:cytochrome b pre-mRNA-processing protein 3